MRITVTGEAKASFPPELATLHLTLGFESGDMEQAVRQATELAASMSREFQLMQERPPSPVTETILLPLSTRSWRPWAQDGSQLPFRHSAASRAKLTFSNFRAMSAFIDGWGREAGVTVDDVEWKLTDKREATEKEAVLAAAVGDAHARATILARAAGERDVRFLELSDLPFSDGGPVAGVFAAAADSRMMRSAKGGEGVDPMPEEIELQATVHARFTTD